MERPKAINMAVVLALFTGILVNSGCASKNVYKGSAGERIEKFSRVDDSLEEKHLEDSGVPEYIK